MRARRVSASDGGALLVYTCAGVMSMRITHKNVGGVRPRELSITCGQCLLVSTFNHLCESSCCCFLSFWSSLSRQL